MVDRSIEGLPTISASRIKVYKTCARQYQYKYVIAREDRPEDHKNVAALLGTALHAAIEKKYKEGKSPTATFQMVMMETMDLWQAEKRVINALDYYPRAMKVGKEILTKFEWDKFNPIATEHAFILPFPAINPIVNINGIIDHIDMDGSIMDYKSASVAPIQDELDNDPQFIIYYWAYTQLYDTTPYRTIWNHLRTNKLYLANIEHNYDLKIAQLKEDIQAMLDNMRYPRRQLDNVCRTKCSFYSLCYGDRAPNLNIEVEE